MLNLVVCKVTARLSEVNTTQSRIDTGPLTGHNLLRRYFHIMRLTDSPFCRKLGAEKTSSHVLCECEALATLRHTCLGFFSFDPEDVKNLGSI
jgi:hypothetical protein